MKRETWYINLSSPHGIETIDSVQGSLAEAQHLIGEYRLAYFRHPELRVWLSKRNFDDE